MRSFGSGTEAFAAGAAAVASFTFLGFAAGKRNNTTIMAVGTGTLETDLEVHAWNVRVPYQVIYTPEMRPVISAGNRWTLELETVPADSITMNGFVTFEEIGG